MEYALVLALIAGVVIVGATALSPVVRAMYCEMLSIMGDPCEVSAEAAAEGTIEATMVHYNRGLEEAHIDATYDGGYDPDVTLTTSPGGVMVQEGDHYDIKFPLSGCPCSITIMSSEGESTTVIVDP
jgi:hypothetical protein